MIKNKKKILNKRKLNNVILFGAILLQICSPTVAYANETTVNTIEITSLSDINKTEPTYVGEITINTNELISLSDINKPKLDPNYKSIFENLKINNINDNEILKQINENIALVEKESIDKEVFNYIQENRNSIYNIYVVAQELCVLHPECESIITRTSEIKTYLDTIDNIIFEYNDLITQYVYSPYFILEITNTKYANISVADEFQRMKDSSLEIVNLASSISLEIDEFNGFYDIEQIRKDIVTTAMSLEGKITYEWDGKPLNAGWNERWNEPGTGLDCSGFMEWVFWTVYGYDDFNLRSTLAITASQQEITYEELQPGDMGTILNEGTYYVDYKGDKHYLYYDAVEVNEAAGYTENEIRTYTNHVGIYVGKDAYGNDIWCHCQGGDVKTVTIGPFEKFTHYYKMPEMVSKNILINE